MTRCPPKAQVRIAIEPIAASPAKTPAQTSRIATARGASQRTAQSKRARSCRAERKPIAIPIKAPAVPVQPTRPTMWSGVVEVLERLVGRAVWPVPAGLAAERCEGWDQVHQLHLSFVVATTWHDARATICPTDCSSPTRRVHRPVSIPIGISRSTGKTFASPKRGHCLSISPQTPSPPPRTHRTLLRPTAADPGNPHRGGAGSAAGRAPATHESARQVGTPIPHLCPPVSSSGGPGN